MLFNRFQWGAQEGPLCDEPIRNVLFRIVETSIAAESQHHRPAQFIPAAKSATQKACLMAEPRLMEPVYYVEVCIPDIN